MIIYGSIIIIALVINILKGGPAFIAIFCKYFFIFLYGLWIYLKGTIIGRRYDEIMIEMVSAITDLV
jgi:hypothetical protein